MYVVLTVISLILIFMCLATVIIAAHGDLSRETRFRSSRLEERHHSMLVP